MRLSFGTPTPSRSATTTCLTSSRAFAGERRADDERMLELLEPYVGQRGRVQRILEASQLAPAAHGPRMDAREIGRI